MISAHPQRSTGRYREAHWGLSPSRLEERTLVTLGDFPAGTQMHYVRQENIYTGGLECWVVYLSGAYCWPCCREGASVRVNWSSGKSSCRKALRGEGRQGGEGEREEVLGREHWKLLGVMQGRICEFTGPHCREGVPESQASRSGDVLCQNS